MLRSTLSPAIVSCALTLIAATCDTTGGDPDFDDVPLERLVAATAVYAQTDAGGAPIQRIVLFDYDNPRLFRVISREDHISEQPRFSPDKRWIVFGDKTIGAVHAPRLVLYDLRTGLADTLWWGPSTTFPLVASPAHIVWGDDSEGFYFTNPEQAFSIRQDVLYYERASGNVSTVHYGQEYSVIPIGLKGSDSLIVVSNEEPATGKPLGYFLMNLNGEYIGSIDHPSLSWTIRARDGVTTKGFIGWSWNDQAKLLAFSYYDSTLVRKRKIAIADLNGLTYEELTSGEYYDDYPVWGPRSTLFAIRAPEFGTDTWEEFKLISINVQTGTITTFSEYPDLFNGALGLTFVDY
jgi:hypothetical protein